MLLCFLSLSLVILLIFMFGMRYMLYFRWLIFLFLLLFVSFFATFYLCRWFALCVPRLADSPIVQRFTVRSSEKFIYSFMVVLEYFLSFSFTSTSRLIIYYLLEYKSQSFFFIRFRIWHIFRRYWAGEESERVVYQKRMEVEEKQKNENEQCMGAFNFNLPWDAFSIANEIKATDRTPTHSTLPSHLWFYFISV